MAQTNETSKGKPLPPVTFEARGERRFIRPGGSRRHIVFRVRGPVTPVEERPARRLVNLAIVLDRSGSMHGDKLRAAKAATQALLFALSDNDRVALLAFDDHMEVVQEAAPATSGLRQHVAEALGRIEARGSTALHEGWLTGCQLIAREGPAPDNRLSRCFLLTDGQANVGERDPERIAMEAAGIRRDAGIVTSTFGFGDDYQEELLGPMAVAGGGQFHNVRTLAEIGQTFSGDLEETLRVEASEVTLRIKTQDGVLLDAVSDYWLAPVAGAANEYEVAVGNLMAGEERFIVVRFTLPRGQVGEKQAIGSSVIWRDATGQVATVVSPQEFEYASDDACDAERRDVAAMHWVGLHYAARAQQEATQLSLRGNGEEACRLLQKVGQRIAEYAGADPELRRAIEELEQLAREVRERPVRPARAKEVRFRLGIESRMQRDLRRPQIKKG